MTSTSNAIILIMKYEKLEHRKENNMDIKNSNSPVAENIERIIKERGLKQVYVAERAGMSSQALCDILKGRRLIRIGEVPSLAYALGVEPNELYS